MLNQFKANIDNVMNKIAYKFYLDFICRSHDLNLISDYFINFDLFLSYRVVILIHLFFMEEWRCLKNNINNRCSWINLVYFRMRHKRRFFLPCLKSTFNITWKRHSHFTCIKLILSNNSAQLIRGRSLPNLNNTLLTEYS